MDINFSLLFRRNKIFWGVDAGCLFSCNHCWVVTLEISFPSFNPYAMIRKEYFWCYKFVLALLLMVGIGISFGGKALIFYVTLLVHYIRKGWQEYWPFFLDCNIALNVCHKLIRETKLLWVVRALCISLFFEIHCAFVGGKKATVL